MICKMLLGGKAINWRRVIAGNAGMAIALIVYRALAQFVLNGVTQNNQWRYYMLLRNVFMTAVACAVLVIAAGTNGKNDNGMNGSADTSMNGAQTGDTMTMSGTVQEFDMEEGMLLVQGDTATDTFYIDEQSMIDTQMVQPGTQVDVKYMEKDGRKVVLDAHGSPSSYNGGKTAVIRKTADQKTAKIRKRRDPKNADQNRQIENGSGEETTITGHAKYRSAESPLSQTDSGTDTYYDQDTEITQNALQQGRESQ